MKKNTDKKIQRLINKFSDNITESLTQNKGLSEIWDVMDTDQNGKISRQEEFSYLVNQLNIPINLTGENINELIKHYNRANHHIRKFDTDADKKLNSTEFENYLQTKDLVGNEAESILAANDLNNDGSLDRLELAKIYTDMDTNQDGKISNAEKFDYYIGEEGSYKHFSRAKSYIKHYDLDGDKLLDSGELNSLLEKKPYLSEITDTLISNFDENDDGKLERIELSKLYIDIDTNNDGKITKTENIDFYINNLKVVIQGSSDDDSIDGGDKNACIYGGEGNDTLKSGTGNNELWGQGGNDFLYNSAEGNNTLYGGIGDDIYYVTAEQTIIVENLNEGNDTVESTVDYTLSANLETLILTGTTGTENLSGTGNELDNALTGNNGTNIISGQAGNDTIDGGLGIDTMAGGSGDDVYYVNEYFDEIIENADEGIDTVYSSTNYKMVSENLENLILTGSSDINVTANELDNELTGNAGNNLFYGNGGNDKIDGGAGVDSLHGGYGNDVYYVDNSNDIVKEYYDQGIDKVYASADFTLTGNLENLELTGSAIIATGNDIYNNITGNDEDNIIDGKAGNDTMTGGLGNDIYYVDQYLDEIIENQGEGIDTVYSSTNYKMVSENLENLVLTGALDLNVTANNTDNNLTGNSGANLFYALDGNDTIDGSGGTDTMYGGYGDDVYYVDQYVDEIIEFSNQGIDTVFASSNYKMVSENLENLTLTGSSNLNVTANNADNQLTGNSGNNLFYALNGNDTIDGGLGIDTVYGGYGDDVYYIDNSNDEVIEFSSQGTDKVFASADYNLTNNIEELELTGSAIQGTGNNLRNTITGNDLNNVIDGGLGIDTMIGGRGDDVYYVNEYFDEIVENAGEGLDTAYSSSSYKMVQENLENLVLTGNSNINVTANNSDNLLTGNSGNNVFYALNGNDTIEGGIGADSMYGGYGNDIFYVDNLNDVVKEFGNQGIDKVYSSVDFTIDYAVEDLELIGGALIGIGNYVDNKLKGNNLNNTLEGREGNDTYIFETGNGLDTIIDNAGSNDIISFEPNVSKADIAIFQDSNNDLTIDYGTTAGTDQIKILDQDGIASTTEIERVEIGSEYLSESDIGLVIQNMMTYINDNSLVITNVEDVRNNTELMNIIHQGWN